jgi:ABC-type lipoprotein release transport system permease subunit
MILGEALTCFLGRCRGLPLTLFAGRAVQTLCGFTPFDLMADVAAIGMLVLMATLAAYVPARRASRLERIVALRIE